MELDLNVLRPQERASLQLRLLYEQEGFRKYHMGRFEEYGLYQENRLPRSACPAAAAASERRVCMRDMSVLGCWTGGCWR